MIVRSVLGRWLRLSEDGTCVLSQRQVAPGETLCEAPEGHDYYVALNRPCDHCGAAV